MSNLALVAGYLARVLTRGGFEVTHELDSASALLPVAALTRVRRALTRSA